MLFLPIIRQRRLSGESGMPLPPEPETGPLCLRSSRAATVQSPTPADTDGQQISRGGCAAGSSQGRSSRAGLLDGGTGGQMLETGSNGASALHPGARRALRLDRPGRAQATTRRQRAAPIWQAVILVPGVNQFKAGEEPVNVTDLASWVVRFGWAEPEEGYYQDEMFEAKEAKRGLYATKETASSGDIIARQQESDALSSELRAQSEAIGPITSPDLLAGANAGALSIMVAPSRRGCRGKKSCPCHPALKCADASPCQALSSFVGIHHDAWHLAARIDIHERSVPLFWRPVAG